MYTLFEAFLFGGARTRLLLSLRVFFDRLTVTLLVLLPLSLRRFELYKQLKINNSDHL